MGQLTCSICGATGTKNGKPFERQGQLNLHVYHCKMQSVHNVSHETFMKESKRRVEKENIECTHEWRFLNRKAPIENKAYLGGYKEVCSQCQELK